MIRSNDRRDSYRLHLDPGQAVVRVKDGPPIELRDLSASGGRLIVRDAGAEQPELPVLEIELASGDRLSAESDIVRARSHEPGVFHLGARFRGLGAESVLKLSRFIAREFQRRTSDPSRLLDLSRSLTVDSPLFIHNLFVQGEARGQTLAVIDRSLRLGGELRVEGVAFDEGRRVIKARFAGGAAKLSLQRPYSFLLSGPSAVTVFESRCLQQSGDEVLLALPAEVRQAGSREGRRIELDEAAPAPMRVSFTHPRLAGVSSGGMILDVAERGLSFSVRSGEHGLFPGDRLPDLRIELPGRTLRARGSVRRIGVQGSGRASCGVELVLFTTRDEAEVWRRFVFGHLHPNVVDGNGRADSAWELLEGSKYVERWTPPAARAHVREEYLRAWQDPPPELGHSLLLYRERGASGMAAGSAVTPRSWVLHHLASDTRGDADARLPLSNAHQVISAILNRLRMETDLEHFLIYLECGKRWNERLYADFAERYFDRDKILLTPMVVHRRSTEAPLPGGGASLPVVEATGPLLSLLARRLAETRPEIERKALALDEDRIRLYAFSEACDRWGQERRRDIFFAFDEERPAAALIAESGGEGVNVFGLLNTCRIVGLVDEVSAAAREALLRRAVEHYRSRDKKHFLLFEETDVDELPGRLGFERVSAGLRWIAHRDVIPAWAAYLEGLLATAAN
jgi:hypothetical protein